MNEQEYYETVSGKFMAYELFISHLLKKLLEKISETEVKQIQADLSRQANIYLTDIKTPEAARVELQRVITEVWTKAQIEKNS